MLLHGVTHSCILGQNITHTVLLFKSLLANLMLQGVEQHPTQLAVEILFITSCYAETGDKSRPDGPLSFSEDFTLKCNRQICLFAR